MKLSKVKRVYVAEYNGNFKIGVTSNVAIRMSKLACGCPTIKAIYQSDFLSNAFEVEVLLHKMYSDQNIGGEWFSSVDIDEISNIIGERGVVTDYGKCKVEETERFSNMLQDTFNKFFLIPQFDLKQEDSRDMTIGELRYENEQILKFGVAIGGADIPNIYSDLIYDILFGKNTEQLVEEYKTKEYESFRKYLSDEQNTIIKKYTNMIGDMINAYWSIERIRDYMETI